VIGGADAGLGNRGDTVAYGLWHYLRDSAARHPDRAAVSWRDTVLTYGQLDERSTALAEMLGRDGIGPGHRVGLLMPKSHRSVVALFGILKTGAAYVPVDPNAPALRATYILRDCGVSGLITTEAKLRQVADGLEDLDSLKAVAVIDGPADATPRPSRPKIRTWSETASPDRAPAPDPAALESDPAYLLYTSGSTGHPKGVILSHRHAMTFVEWGAEKFGVRPEDRLSNHAPLHFDLSIFDIFAAVRCGACVCLVPDPVALFPMELARWIADERISVWYSVPSALTRILLHGSPERFSYERLRAVLFAGEVFPVKFLREIMDRWAHAEFYNLYGPTETNVCTYFRVPRPLGDDVSEIPIGEACENTEVFALDEAGRRIGPGEEGELHVRGPAVMLGYWGLPDRTRDALIDNPLQPAYREAIYGTGDLVRMLPEGSYMFVGRKDHMVKARGYRIELGEIEAVLYRDEAIREAAVVAIQDDEIGARLVAVVALDRGKARTESELKAFCARHLPNYMVPERFDFQAELPTTSTGKTDRVTLAERMGAGAKGGA